MPTKPIKSLVNVQFEPDQPKIGKKGGYFCGYNSGKKYMEQTERYATEKEAVDALGVLGLTK